MKLHAALANGQVKKLAAKEGVRARLREVILGTDAHRVFGSACATTLDEPIQPRSRRSPLAEKLRGPELELHPANYEGADNDGV
jgi:hypothetical protein